ncbi:MAG TPA: (2Fe-2S) ferredoxin domain-containing protein [Bacillota bacterium]|jgi:NADH:ubiquinone oxidoreductase subunit E|nr:(2Fe-2S) ferredoxin domain-containing protein [Bacillota bacterium]
MIIVSVCVGSSCHIKGAPQIIERFQQLIQTYDLWNQVELRGVFCMERCTQGVTIEIGGEVLSAIDVTAAEELFRARVLVPLGFEPSGH